MLGNFLKNQKRRYPCRIMCCFGAWHTGPFTRHRSLFRGFVVYALVVNRERKHVACRDEISAPMLSLLPAPAAPRSSARPRGPDLVFRIQLASRNDTTKPFDCFLRCVLLALPRLHDHMVRSLRTILFACVRCYSRLIE